MTPASVSCSLSDISISWMLLLWRTSCCSIASCSKAKPGSTPFEGECACQLDVTPTENIVLQYCQLFQSQARFDSLSRGSVLGVADFASRGADFATRVADFATRTSMSPLFQGAGQVRELEGSVFQVSPIDPCRGSLVIFSKEVKFR